MSARCRYGHESATTDYCDQCGAPIDVPAPAPAAHVAPPGLTPSDETVTDEVTQRPLRAPGELCPKCGSPRLEGGRFCEADGFDFEAPPQRWAAVVTADRGYFDAMGADVMFPVDYPSRSFLITVDEVLIGRRIPGGHPSATIDLQGPPEDEAVSRRHAMLRRASDGSYSVTDLASTNGTRLNDDMEPLPAHVRMPLVDGDAVHLGAWTTITMQALRAE